MSTGRACDVEGCDRPRYARGVCQRHYDRAYQIGAHLDLPLAPMNRRHPPNPWSGRLVCPQCDSSDWTLPFDPTVRNTSWRCVACHIWAAGPMAQTRTEGAA